MDVSGAKKAAGVIAVVTAPEVGDRKKGKFNTAKLFGGNEVSIIIRRSQSSWQRRLNRRVPLPRS